MTVVQVIIGNLWGFDTSIFVVALANLFIFREANRRAGKLHDMLHRTLILPLCREDGPMSEVNEELAVNMREAAERLYTIFVNLTAIFPLLGILGTVLSLIPMVGELSNMQTNFFEALTSTFWGLVFSIGFKVADGFLASKMDDNDRNVTLLLERRKMEKEVVSL